MAGINHQTWVVYYCILLLYPHKLGFCHYDISPFSYRTSNSSHNSSGRPEAQEPGPCISQAPVAGVLASSRATMLIYQEGYIANHRLCLFDDEYHKNINTTRTWAVIRLFCSDQNSGLLWGIVCMKLGAFVCSAALQLHGVACDSWPTTQV